MRQMQTTTGAYFPSDMLEGRKPRFKGNGHCVKRRHSAHQQQNNKWGVLVIVAISVFMATLDTSIVTISLPAIARAFGVPLSGAIEWIVIAYLVTIAGTLLTIGRLADLIGRKPIQLTGLLVFMAGSALCGCSVSLLQLIAARAVQGLGAACIMAVGPAMLTHAFPQSERGRALGMNALFVALGTSAGPALGGLIMASTSWRFIFFVNLPLGGIGLLVCWWCFKERLPHRHKHFDPLGALLPAIGLASLIASLSFGQEVGWTSLPILASFVVGVLALAILPFVERRVPHPMLALSLLRHRVFTSAMCSLVLSFLSLFAVSFMLPFYFEELRGFSPAQAGWLFTILPLTMACVAPISGWLSDRIGTRTLAAGGLTLAGAGLLAISLLGTDNAIWDIIWRLMLTGAGQAIFQSPNNSALMGAAPRHLQGSASGFLATGRVIGQSVSVALAGTIFAGFGGATAGHLLSQSVAISPVSRSALQESFVTSFHAVFLSCALLAAMGVLVAFMRGREQDQTPTHKDAVPATSAEASMPVSSQLVPMLLSSHQRPTQAPGLAEMTRQLQARLQQAPRREAPVLHDDPRPRIALLTRTLWAQDLSLLERLRKEAQVLLLSPQPSPACGEESDEPFRRAFEQLIWPSFLQVLDVRIQGLCLLSAHTEEETAIRGTALSLPHALGLLAWLIGLPLLSIQRPVPQDSTDNDLSLQEGSKEARDLTAFLSASAHSSLPASQSIVERREELYWWLYLQEKQLATFFPASTRIEGPIRTSHKARTKTPEDRLARKRRIMQQQHTRPLTVPGVLSSHA